MNNEEGNTIWIIDDDQSILEALQIVLNQKGYNVKIIDSGSELAKELLTELPDLMLLDIYIADINGRDIVRELKRNEKTRSIPIILTTADVFAISNAKRDKYKADEFLAKPFALEEFLALVKKYLKKS